ncbi:MAG: hypothetical protein ABSA66_08115 [Roseiarcus sp.]
MRAVATAALLAGGIVAASPARAATAPQAAPTSLAPMRFLHVRSGGSTCRTDCPEWISAEGKIVMGTADALARVIAALGDRRLPIFINSAGGSVQDAMAMGRLIRAKRLAVVVARTAIAPCAASARECGEARGSAESWGAYCASACTLVLAGGIERYVSPLSFVGVHQLTEIVSKTQVKRLYSVRYFSVAGLKLELSRTLVGERRSTATTKRTADKGVDDSVDLYLAEMGVLDPMMKLTLATPARDIHWLTADELETSRLATIWVDGASPIVDDAGASGVRGEPIDARSGAASLFVAKSASPLERPVEGRPAALEASFAYRRGGGMVFATLLARDSADGTAVDVRGSGIFVILYPEGAEFRAGKIAAGEPMRVAIPVRSFCRLGRGGRAIVSFIEPIPGTAAGTNEAAHPSEPPVAIDPVAAQGAKPLFDEACPRNATASR